jgi:cytochrome c-type biogenesis protein CcmH
MSLWFGAAVLAALTVAALGWRVWRAGGRAELLILVAFVVPGIALASYAFLGEPDLPDQPHAARGDAQMRAEMQGLLAELQAKLEDDPGRIDGWLLLGRSRMRIGDYDQAAEAFARARALAPGEPAIAAELGEALIHAAGGAVPEAARETLLSAHAQDPREPKALFYLGHDAATRADHAAAVQFWTDLVAVAPPGAPWAADVRARIAREAAIGNIDLAKVTPSVQPAAPVAGPSAEEAAAAAAMSPEERAAFIRSMVERLAARLETTPDDVEGWRRLANAWRVLGESGKADAAEARVRALEGRN